MHRVAIPVDDVRIDQDFIRVVEVDRVPRVVDPVLADENTGRRPDADGISLAGRSVTHPVPGVRVDAGRAPGALDRVGGPRRAGRRLPRGADALARARALRPLAP